VSGVADEKGKEEKKKTTNPTPSDICRYNILKYFIEIQRGSFNVMIYSGDDTLPLSWFAADSDFG